ncbi:hypothetical protein AB1N83_004533 [Pleurotus pulmonarius]
MIDCAAPFLPFSSRVYIDLESCLCRQFSRATLVNDSQSWRWILLSVAVSEHFAEYPPTKQELSTERIFPLLFPFRRPCEISRRPLTDVSASSQSVYSYPSLTDISYSRLIGYMAKTLASPSPKHDIH